MSVSLTAIQENVIVLLCYSDEHSATIRNVMPPELWSGPYKEISRRVYEYIDRYRVPPKDHIADLLADKLDNKKGEASLYEDILIGIRSQQSSVNPEYALNQLQQLVRRQSYRSIAVELAKELQRDTDDSLDRAEQLIKTATTQIVSVFDPGTRLSDADKVLGFLDRKNDSFPTGIPELDKRGFGPTRGELHLYIAATKRGKTFWLIQLAKMAAMHRLKVAHYSLEMSEAKCAQRYMQAFFAMAKRDEKQRTVKFSRDSLGRMDGLQDVELKPKLSMDDPNIRSKLEKKIKQFGSRYLDNIVVKQFPSGNLTVRQLEAHLDGLESNERFIPDLLIVDYPDLMKIDKDNFRLGIDLIYKELRGIAVSRNIALAIVSQGNRGSERAKNVGNDHVAEAWSKIAHADCVITYNQTQAERGLGLARLAVSAGRNDEQITVIISQNYAFGSYVQDSILMAGANYWDNIPNEETD
jgi:replicative DNA helicase